MTLELLLIALCVSLEPIPLTGFILTLSTDRGARNGAAFLCGWVVSLAAVIGITLAFTAGKPPEPATTPSTAVLAAKLALGVGLLIFAWHYRRTPPKEHSDPAWMKKIDQMSVWAAAVLAFLLQPWGLVAAAALTITEATTSKTSTWVTLVVFCVLATASLAGMEAYVVLSPDAAKARLAGLRQWMDDHKKSMVVYLSVVVGLILVSASAVALAN